MRLLLTGSTGQVGRMLVAIAPPATLIAAPPRAALDLARPETFTPFLDARPDVVVNAAAFTAVDLAEREPEAAFAVNRDGAAALARQCAERGIALIHLSTDYVFDGRKDGAYLETDPAAPLSVYGRSKLEGETAVRALNERHVILRCSWVFGPHGPNFVRSIVARGARGETLSIVNDQRGCPTATSSIARAILAVARRMTHGDAVWGTYHYAGQPAVTWFEFAEAIVTEARRWMRRTPQLAAIRSEDHVAPAPRPANSVLDCTAFTQRFGLAPESWQAPLAESVAIIGAALAPSRAHPRRA
jgi:dTDP-4-dehydrorhamnose reductase